MRVVKVQNVECLVNLPKELTHHISTCGISRLDFDASDTIAAAAAEGVAAHACAVLLKGLRERGELAARLLPTVNVRGEGLSPVLPDGSLYVNARIARGGGADLGAAGVARGGMGSGERPSAEGEGALQLVDGLVTFRRPEN